MHVCKRETLLEAYRLAKRNDGAPGIDGVTFVAIEAEGLEEFLDQLLKEVQGALKLILEPIFEADFQPGSFGYRPKQSTSGAIQRVAGAILTKVGTAHVPALTGTDSRNSQSQWRNPSVVDSGDS